MKSEVNIQRCALVCCDRVVRGMNGGKCVRVLSLSIEGKQKRRRGIDVAAWRRMSVSSKVICYFQVLP